MKFGKQLKALRDACGMTQYEVAKKLNISQSNISGWEHDVTRPDYENLILLSKLYDASLYELLDIEGNRD